MQNTREPPFLKGAIEKVYWESLSLGTCPSFWDASVTIILSGLGNFLYNYVLATGRKILPGLYMQRWPLE